MNTTKDIQQVLETINAENEEIIKKLFGGKIRPMKKRFVIIAVVLLFVLFCFVDLTPNITIKEIEEKYEISIEPLGLFYNKEIHFPTFLNINTVHVFRGDREYDGKYWYIVIRISENEKKINKEMGKEIDSLKLTLSKTDYLIKIIDFKIGAVRVPKATSTLSVNNGYMYIEVFKDDIEDNSVEYDTYLTIMYDLLYRIIEWR